MLVRYHPVLSKRFRKIHRGPMQNWIDEAVRGSAAEVRNFVTRKPLKGGYSDDPPIMVMLRMEITTMADAYGSRWTECRIVPAAAKDFEALHEWWELYAKLPLAAFGISPPLTDGGKISDHEERAA